MCLWAILRWTWLLWLLQPQPQQPQFSQEALAPDPVPVRHSGCIWDVPVRADCSQLLVQHWHSGLMIHTCSRRHWSPSIQRFHHTKMPLLTAHRHLYNHSASLLCTPFVMCGTVTAMDMFWLQELWVKSQTAAGFLSSTWQTRCFLVSEEECFSAGFCHVWSSALMPISGAKKTYSWGILWCLPGLWKSNFFSMCFKLSPKTKVHWKMLSLLGGSSTQNFLFALSQNPVSQSVPAVWPVHQAMLKPAMHHRFLPKGSISLYRKMFSSGKKKVWCGPSVHECYQRWLKARFCMSWDNAAVSSSSSLKHFFDSVAFQFLTSITWKTINDGSSHWGLILVLFECIKVKQFSIFLLPS